MGGRTVVITGANSGVGKATATALAAAGADTVITARHQDRGREALADIRRASGSDQVDLVVFDLADLASVRRGAEQSSTGVRRIDVLVNNAGLVLSERTETMDGFEATFAINHLGPFLLTRLLTDRLVDVGAGPGGQRGLHRPPVRPPRPGLRRPPVTAALPGHAGLRPFEAGQHPVHHRAGPAAVRRPG